MGFHEQSCTLNNSLLSPEKNISSTWMMNQLVQAVIPPQHETSEH